MPPTPEWVYYVVSSSVGAIFAAGVAWWQFQTLRIEVKAMRAEVKGTNRRIETLEKLMLVMCPPDQRQTLMDLLREAEK